MKNFILKASAMAFAAGLMGTLACGGTSSSCGGTNINDNSASPTVVNQCGVGTYLNGSVCLPIPKGGSSSSAAATKAISN